MMDAEGAKFADRVRGLYLDIFGDDAFKGADGEPAALSSILVLMESHYLDGETGLITFYDGSYTTCKGMAWRFLADDHLEDED